MRQKLNPFAVVLPIFGFVAASPLHAADVNTTGGTTVLNTDAPGNKYLGNGTLQVSTDGSPEGQIFLGSAASSPITEFAMTSGGLITIDSGVSLVNGGHSKGVWTNNKADLTVNGTLDMWDGNPVFVNALNGAGAVLTNWPWGGSARQLNVGVDGGGGTFSGSIEGYDTIANTFIRVIKNGVGTQVFDNLAVQQPHEIVLNAGVVDLSAATNATMPSRFFGAGNLVKSGAGALTVSGALLNLGTTTVNAGELTLNANISAKSQLVAAAGTKLNLDFSGNATVRSLTLDGVTLGAGVYDASHGTYGAFFGGTGALNVLNGVLPTASGSMLTSGPGFWSVSSRWQGGTIGNGSGSSATIGASSAANVNLDSDYTLTHLAFEGADHTLSGASTLTLAGTLPGVTVASGTQSTIQTQIAGSAGLIKSGVGTLNLTGSNKTYPGGTSVNGGRLVLQNLLTGSPTYSVATGATLDFNTTGATNANRQLSGGTISGAGNLVKTGDGRLLLGANGARQNIALASGALIDVQAGVLRGEYGNQSGGINGWINNKADLNVASGAFFDIWDSNAIVDSITGSGTINKGWSANSTLTFGIDNGSGTFSGTISQGAQSYGGANGGSFSLIKTGTGTQIFSGTVNPTGTTTISGGTLVINGSISTSSLTTVGNGATLSGNNGTVGALTVQSGGTLAPGNSPGILNAGNTDLQAGATLSIEINSATVGTGYDQLNVTGSVSLAGLLSVTMGHTPALNGLFFILANDGTDAITGTFSNAAVNGGTYTLGGQAFQISYTGNQTAPGTGTFTGGNDVVLMAVPEPTVALLGGLGLLTLLRRRRD